MAHRSRLAGFIIDCRNERVETAAEFWGAALGLRVTDPNGGGEGRYAVLGDMPADLHIEVPKVDHESRVHLDIQADDIEAEFARLIMLGAIEVSRPHNARWVVMQPPAGQRFRVVGLRNADKGPRLNRW